MHYTSEIIKNLEKKYEEIGIKDGHNKFLQKYPNFISQASTYIDAPFPSQKYYDFLYKVILDYKDISKNINQILQEHIRCYDKIRYEYYIDLRKNMYKDDTLHQLIENADCIINYLKEDNFSNLVR